jgi:hypothetical protein
MFFKLFHLVLRHEHSHEPIPLSTTYSPADSRFPLFFELTHPLDDLESMLLKDFARRSLSLQAICEEHCVGKPYILENSPMPTETGA